MEKLLELKEFLWEKKYYVIGGLVVLILFIFFIYFNINNKDKDIVEDLVYVDSNIQEEIVEEIKCNLKVDIKGEINVPGLYEVSCDSRVLDVINLAGGITNKADISVLNLSKKVTDEMVIIVYSKQEIKDLDNTKEVITKKIESCINITEIKNDACIKSDDINDDVIGEIVEDYITDTPVNNLISLNNASKEELMTLSGIGESKAIGIINYRTTNNGFKSIEEIKNVKGIGDSIFEKIKGSITL